MIAQRYIKFVIYTLHSCILSHPSTCIYATLSCLSLSVCPYSHLPAHPLHCRLCSRAHRSPPHIHCHYRACHPPHIPRHYRVVYVRGYRDSVLRTLMGVVVHASARRYLYNPVHPSEARIGRGEDVRGSEDVQGSRRYVGDAGYEGE